MLGVQPPDGSQGCRLKEGERHSSTSLKQTEGQKEQRCSGGLVTDPRTFGQRERSSACVGVCPYVCLHLCKAEGWRRIYSWTEVYSLPLGLFTIPRGSLPLSPALSWVLVTQKGSDPIPDLKELPGLSRARRNQVNRQRAGMNTDMAGRAQRKHLTQWGRDSRRKWHLS